MESMVSSWGRQLAFAFRFFTNFPLFFKVKLMPGDIAQSGKWFTFVAFFEGVFVSVAIYISFLFSDNAYVGALVCLIARLIISRSQVENMAHTVDGLYSSRSRVKIVEVMLDDKFGSRGVVMMLVDCLLKYVLYYQLLVSLDVNYTIPILICSCIGGKLAIATGVGASSSVFKRDRMLDDSKKDVAIVSGIVAAGLAYILLGLPSMILLLILEVSIGLIISGLLMLKIGGLTKQTLSLIGEVGELAFLYMILIW